MTYFLIFQFGYMVLGTLYAAWRVVWALLVTLLYWVAALDRSLFMMFTVS